jgi:hypothetical protein
MTLVEILPIAQKLSSIEKLRLIQILAEDLEISIRALEENSPEDEKAFWLRASQASLDAVWNNNEDDVYTQLC